MGVDIHMFICQDNKVIQSNIYDGRNSEWFDNLQGSGWDDVYDKLPMVYGWPSMVPDELKEEYSREKGCYGYHHILVKNYKIWYVEYNPYKRAGWVTTYDKWKMENQGYIPETAKTYLDEDDVLADMYFVEWKNEYDPSTWLYNYLCDNKIDNNAWIVYCFDN